MSKKLNKEVAELLKEFKDPKASKRFSKSELMELFAGILTDKKFKTYKKTYNFAKGEKKEEEVIYAELFEAFLDDVYKVAGLKEEERKALIDKFEIKSKHVEFMMDAMAEAQWQYVNSGKSLNMWIYNDMNLFIKKMIRSGKYEGEETLKRKVRNNELVLAKKKKANK